MEYGTYVTSSSRAFAKINRFELQQINLREEIARTDTSILYSADEIGKQRLLVEMPLGRHNDVEKMLWKTRAAHLGGSVLRDMFPQFADQFVPTWTGVISVPESELGAIIMQDRTLRRQLPLRLQQMKTASSMLLKQGLAHEQGIRAAFGTDLTSRNVMYGDDAADYMVDASAFMPTPGSALAMSGPYMQAQQKFKRWGHESRKYMDGKSVLAQQVLDIYNSQHPAV